MGTAFTATRDTLDCGSIGCAPKRRRISGKGNRLSQGHGGAWTLWRACPRCGEKIQRIRYADNETNYCARCQTGGKLLADRSLSRLLGSDWPRTLDELEALKRR